MQDCAGTADGSDAAHIAAPRTVYRSLGDVRPTSDVLGLIAVGVISVSFSPL